MGDRGMERRSQMSPSGVTKHFRSVYTLNLNSSCTIFNLCMEILSGVATLNLDYLTIIHIAT